eukprot:6556599-Pyramimonas_sp.AAC.1
MASAGASEHAVAGVYHDLVEGSIAGGVRGGGPTIPRGSYWNFAADRTAGWAKQRTWTIEIVPWCD